MENYRIIQLIETDDETGEKSQIGGGITRLRIGAVNGPLHEIDVAPVSVEDLQKDTWDDDSFVRLQVADRVVWMNPEEVETLINLLELAKQVSLKNFNKVRF